ncbi:uncharacterized protein AMSG_00916 [Thecamonas trahens ATCC 50062]|uniref:Uncharacterized protein n=1 Tax=Thecamonas trahens ATCC 50062 TaxID=461836 RepID=A0A0L0DL42_THETB|nr:hypothetical protein AMSG_00916 [Thecamonas trahens ATCC 50062]KNC52088.1 hypothetical protein AMSG_00916 [Thecamonas trahens ATCC 50062]|eukprot:XP_013762093.1 hypothetical protein AMSG_00916 [Thecamonas trahens ATCC 50062]
MAESGEMAGLSPEEVAAKKEQERKLAMLLGLDLNALGLAPVAASAADGAGASVDANTGTSPSLSGGGQGAVGVGAGSGASLGANASNDAGRLLTSAPRGSGLQRSVTMGADAELETERAAREAREAEAAAAAAAVDVAVVGLAKGRLNKDGVPRSVQSGEMPNSLFGNGSTKSGERLHEINSASRASFAFSGFSDDEGESAGGGDKAMGSGGSGDSGGEAGLLGPPRPQGNASQSSPIVDSSMFVSLMGNDAMFAELDNLPMGSPKASPVDSPADSPRSSTAIAVPGSGSSSANPRSRVGSIDQSDFFQNSPEQSSELKQSPSGLHSDESSGGRATSPASRLMGQSIRARKATMPTRRRRPSNLFTPPSAATSREWKIKRRVQVMRNRESTHFRNATRFLAAQSRIRSTSRRSVRVSSTFELSSEQEAKLARYSRRAYLTSLQKRVKNDSSRASGGASSLAFLPTTNFRGHSGTQVEALVKRSQWVGDLERVVEWPMGAPLPPWSKIMYDLALRLQQNSAFIGAGVHAGGSKGGYGGVGGQESSLLTALMEQKKDEPSRSDRVVWDEPDSPDNLVVEIDANNHEIVVAGTLAKLVERLTYHRYPDPMYLSAFLLTYRSFTTPPQLLDLLEQRFNATPPAGASGEELMKFRKTREIQRIRVLLVFKQWVANHFDDYVDVEGLLDSLKQVLAKMKGSGVEKGATKLMEDIAKREAQEHKSRRMLVFDTPPPPPLVPESADASTFSLLSIPPRELARQVTLREFALYSAIKPYECLNQAWAVKPDEVEGLYKAPHIRSIISRFNAMSEYVAVTILREAELEARVAVVTRFIQIASELRKINNFNGVMEILAGLQLTPIFRLKRTWAGVSPRNMSKFNELAAEMNRDLNYKAPRAALATANPPCIPYLGIFLTDLTFVEDGNSDLTPSGLINFDKRRRLALIIGEVQQYQQTPYCLQALPQLQDWIWGESEAVEYDESVMYDRSLEVEPRESTA